jgi:hypothetical protein
MKSKPTGGVSLGVLAPVLILLTILTFSFPGLFTSFVSSFQGPTELFVVTGSPLQFTNTADRSMNSNFSYNYPTIVGRAEGEGFRVVFPEAFTSQMTQLETTPGGICEITVTGYNVGNSVISATNFISTTNCQQ